MPRFDSSPRRRTSYQFTIRRNPGGSWLAEEIHGSLGGIFVSCEAAVRFALRETDGDADRDRVRIEPAPAILEHQQAIAGEHPHHAA
jgi:hypothetical protein